MTHEEADYREAISVIRDHGWRSPHNRRHFDLAIEAIERLRSVASASADAEKGFKEYMFSLGVPLNFFENKERARKEGITVNDGLKGYREAYLAGHATATAAMQAEVDGLRAENEELRAKRAICDDIISCREMYLQQQTEKDTDLAVMCEEVERLTLLERNNQARRFPGLPVPEQINTPRATEILAKRKERQS